MSTGSQLMPPLHPLTQVSDCFRSGEAANFHEWRHSPEHVADTHVADVVEDVERSQLFGGAFGGRGWRCSCHGVPFLLEVSVADSCGWKIVEVDALLLGPILVVRSDPLKGLPSLSEVLPFV